MELLWNILGLAALVVGMVAAVVVAVSMVSVYMLPRASLLPLSPDQAAEYARQSRHELGSGLIDGEGFQWIGAYLFQSVLGKITIAAWQQPGSPTYACVYFLPTGKTQIDIVSIFRTDPDLGLTTGTSRDGHFTPRAPGHYIQTFSGLDPATLWQRHVEAEQLLAQSDDFVVQDHGMAFDELLMYAIAQQTSHVRTLPLWPLRMLWHYTVTRYARHNKPLGELLQE